jgi:hypothetical protein
LFGSLWRPDKYSNVHVSMFPVIFIPIPIYWNSMRNPLRQHSEPIIWIEQTLNDRLKSSIQNDSGAVRSGCLWSDLKTIISIRSRISPTFGEEKWPCGRKRLMDDSVSAISSDPCHIFVSLSSNTFESKILPFPDEQNVTESMTQCSRVGW